MKTALRLACLLLLAASASAQGRFESIGVEVTVEPQIPAGLMMSGLPNGQVVVAIDVDAEGKLVDWLVLRASHRELIRSCVDTLPKWKYRPARYDGLPVLAQLQLTIDISQKGAVVSGSAVDMMANWVERLGPRRNDYQVCPASEIDRPIAPVFTVPPQFPVDAARKPIHGRVKVHFYIDESGAVRMPAVHADTQPFLSFVAIKALREWKFEPPTRQGKPVLVAATQEFTFGEGE